MPEALEYPTVHVEGGDDEHSIKHLLIRHGIDYYEDGREIKPRLPNLPEFNRANGVDRLLKGMPTAISLSTGRAVGFVLDADSPLQGRWLAVRDRLRAVDVDTPDAPPPEGFVGNSAKYK